MLQVVNTEGIFQRGGSEDALHVRFESKALLTT